MCKRSWPVLAVVLTLAFGGIGLLSGMLMVGGGTAVSQAAPLATLYVDPILGNDGNACTAPGASACATIGGAIGKANHGDLIKLTSGTYTEHSLTIDRDITLEGTGAASTIIDADFQGRHFGIYGNVTLRDLTLQNGLNDTASGSIFDRGAGSLLLGSGYDILLDGVILYNNSAAGVGGAIFNLSNLTLDNSQIISNSSTSGGGIYQYAFGYTIATSTLISGNVASAQGGGVLANEPVYLMDVTVANNVAGSSGGGVYGSGLAILERVTISGNQASIGAGIYAQTGGVELKNVTVSGNTATSNMGGIYMTGATTYITITNATIANNDRVQTSGTGYNGLRVVGGATATVQHTLLDGNEDRNCGISSTFFSLGHNLSSDFRCPFTSTGDISGTAVLLSPLGNYGGETETHALLEGSPAIDAGSNSACPAVDQRGESRPFDGDGDGTATCDIGAFEVTPQLSVADVIVNEGDSGSTAVPITVTLFPTSTESVTFLASTVAGSANAGSDYTAFTNQLVTISPGASSTIVSVDLLGDTDDENDEQFSLQLTLPTNATLIDDSGTVTIIDDDGLPSLTIADLTFDEGDLGNTSAMVEVTLSPMSGDTVTVDVATSNGSAIAGEDYIGTAETLTFPPGESSQMVSIPIIGDRIDEGTSENFKVSLSGASEATIADGNAVVTITDDDNATLRQELGPSVLEGDSGSQTAFFTVTLSTPTDFAVTVDFAISDGVGDSGATFGSDYTGTLSGTLIFQPGETLLTYSVEILGDTETENDERIHALLSNGSLPFTTNSTSAIILNDDGVLFDEVIFLPLVVR